MEGDTDVLAIKDSKAPGVSVCVSGWVEEMQKDRQRKFCFTGCSILLYVCLLLVSGGALIIVYINVQR